jgi:hypothetical protein
LPSIRKRAETERSKNRKKHKGKRHNSFCLKPERGIKEKGIQKRVIINFVPNRKGA